MEVLNEDWNEDFVFESRDGGDDDDEVGWQQQQQQEEQQRRRQQEEKEEAEFWGYEDHHDGRGVAPPEGHRMNGMNGLARAPVDRTKACSVIVPQAIKERQANVHGDLGQVRDFALLVEELKRLRLMATSKGIVDGPSAELWHEADDIIDLASPEHDQQPHPPHHHHQHQHHLNHNHNHNYHHHQAIQPPRSPSSPGFGLGFDPFEDEPSPVSTAPSRKRRKSVLSLEDDFYDAPQPASASASAPRERAPENGSAKVSPSLSRMPSRSSRPPPPPPPPHESPSMARAVIETMHQRRAAPSPSAVPTRKMPFDSTTLRELVAHVRMLCRHLTELVVVAESPLSSRSQSPHLSPPPSFGQVLSGSVSSSPSFGTARPSKKSKSAPEVLTPIKGKDNELNGHILMAVI